MDGSSRNGSCSPGGLRNCALSRWRYLDGRAVNGKIRLREEPISFIQKVIPYSGDADARERFLLGKLACAP